MMQDFKTRKPKNSFHVVVYSELFNNGIEALNFILEKCVAEFLLDLQYNLASLHYRVLHRVLAWLAIGDFHCIIRITNAAAVDSSLHLSIFA